MSTIPDLPSTERSKDAPAMPPPPPPPPDAARAAVTPPPPPPRPADAPMSEPETRRDRAAWRRALLIGMATYLVTRVCVLVAAAVRASQLAVDARVDGIAEPSTSSSVTGVLTSWDGLWYLEVARQGYPSSIPPSVTFEQIEARAAFFPLFPGAIRLVDSVLPGGDTFAAIVLNLVLGALAVLLVGLLARDVADERVAMRAMVLFAIFPGSFVLSFAYAEALMIVFAGTCLLFLRDQRWFLAGLAAMLTTATRPNGLAIIAACAVASFLAIRRDRAWSSLAAPLLAPLGFVGFMLYLDSTAGERRAWFRVQREAWDEGVSFGWTAVRSVGEFLTDPLASPTGALTVASLLAAGLLLYSSFRARLPWEWLAYSLVILAMVLIPETVTIRPRFVFASFPLFIGLAAWWPQPTGERASDELTWGAWNLLVLASGAGLVGLTGLYAVFGAIP